MATFGLTQQQRKNYFTKSTTRVPENVIDYVELFVFDLDDVLLERKKFTFSELVSDNYVEYSGVLKLNIGQHLRDLGYSVDDFRVEYKFFKRVAGNSQQRFLYELSNGNEYNQDQPFGTKEVNGELRYFVIDSEGEFDLERELVFSRKSYNIFDISPDRKEVVIQSDPTLPEIQSSFLNNQLKSIDRDIVIVPLKSDYEELIEGELKFVTPDTDINQENYILELPENDSNGFDESMVGKRIVFESFFKAQIPTHYKGQYIPDGRLDYAAQKGLSRQRDILIPKEEYIITQGQIDSALSGQPTTIPYLKNNEDFTVTNYNSFDTSKVSDEGFFVKSMFKELDFSNVTQTPNNIWQTRDLGPRSEGKYHYDFAGFFPYRYDKKLDQDNIDLDGILGSGGAAGLKASKLRNFSGGYILGKNLENVYIDWNTTITRVINNRTIEVKSNLDSSYYKLRELGYRIIEVGNAEYVRPNQILELPFGKMSTKQFYIDDEQNDIQNFKTFLEISGDSYLVINSKRLESGTAFKLKEPLQPNIISVNDDIEQDISYCEIVEEVLENYIDNVRLIPKQKVNDTFLLPANFDGQSVEINKRPIEFKSHDNLLGSDNEHNRKLERLLTSGSLLDVQPNIDYQKTTTDTSIELDDTGFGNFVHFSNAESRVRNFKTKLVLIEGYSAESASLESIKSSGPTIKKIEKKRQRVIDSFTPYEDFLYFESSSYSSGSNGQFHDTSWPKTNSTEPYKLVHTSGSTATTWFDNMISSASTYDFNNQDSLRNTLPEHINQDPANNVFLEFMDMVGEQFDETWSYINTLTDINFRVNNISEGISKDVAKHYSDALGIKLFNGNDLVDLSEYLLGKNTDGTDKNESSAEALTEEIWKRLLANLPFFIKTKGTERALKGILNCYGIPSSVLRVREFGGPDKGTRVSYEIKRKFTRALDFKAGQYIKTDWKSYNSLYPNTTEFRFRTPYSVGSSGSMVLVQKSGSGAGSEGSWAISLQDNGTNDNYGYLRFSISASDGTSQFITSSLQQFYNDEMWSVMLTRKLAGGNEISSELVSQDTTYELTTKQYDSTRQRIIYEDTIASSSAAISKYNAAYTSSGHLYLGGSGTGNHGTQFSGSMMEFRLWSEALSGSVFNNHVRVPKAYNGNFTSSAYDNLLLRLPLDDNKNLQTNPTASNIAHLNIYSGSYLGSQINGFTGNFYRTIIDQEKLKVPNVGIRRNATKIRLENNSIPSDVNLSPDIKQEESSQDFAPIDSNKLGVYFSPTDVINEDIIYTFADFNFDDQIGDPRDEYEDSYRGLQNTRHTYFKRYKGGRNNFFDYLRILDFYDDSVFEVLKQFIPARAKSDLGNLIEPNLLERNKQRFNRKIETTQPYYENANDEEVGIQITRFISSSNDNNIRLSGEFPYHESVISYATESIYRGSAFSTLVHINEVNPRDVDNMTYATASVTRGGTSIEFTEAVQPFISASRLSEHNEIREFYYTSSLSVSTANGFGENFKYPGGLYIYSSSFEPTDLERSSGNSVADRLYFLGTQLNRTSDVNGEEPVSITFTNPTKLVTQTPGESRLKTE